MSLDRRLPIHIRGFDNRRSGLTRFLERLVQRNDTKLAFLHIAKAAGSSVTQMLVTHLPSGAVRTHYPITRADGLGHYFRSDFIAYLEQLRASGQDTYAVLSGHIPLCLSGSTPSPLTYFSFLRDPLVRMASGFAYGNRAHDLSTEQLKRHMHISISLAESPGFDNSLVRLLAARDALIPEAPQVTTWELPPVTAGDATVAIGNLSAFGFVGLVERYRDSCGILGRLLRLETPSSDRLNVTENKLGFAEYPEPTKRAIAYRHREDLKLYRAGVERYNEDAEAAGLPPFSPQTYPIPDSNPVSSGDYSHEVSCDDAFSEVPSGVWMSLGGEPARGIYLGRDFGMPRHCQGVSIRLPPRQGADHVSFFVEASDDEFRQDIRRTLRVDVPADGNGHAFDLGSHHATARYWRLLFIPDGRPLLLAIASLAFDRHEAPARRMDEVEARITAMNT